MRLYLTQHGAAMTKTEDVARPLSPKGRHDITRVAGFLSLFESPSPKCVYTSPRLRSQQSAMMFAEAWSLTGVQEHEALLPDADPQLMAEVLIAKDEDCLLVGHLPHLSRLVGLLVVGDAVAEPMQWVNGGVVCLVSAAPFTCGQWQIAWSIRPSLFY